MKLVKQNSPTTCGQACLATFLGISLNRAIAMVGHDEITLIDDLIECLPITEGFDGPPPNDMIALQYHSEPNGTRGHWTISNFGKILDPACKDKLWPVLFHWKLPSTMREQIDYKLDCVVNYGLKPEDLYRFLLEVREDYIDTDSEYLINDLFAAFCEGTLRDLDDSDFLDLIYITGQSK